MLAIGTMLHELPVKAAILVQMDPCREQQRHLGMQVADQYVIIPDKYPKARLHGLVIARNPSLAGPDDLRAEHLPLLLAMQVIVRCHRCACRTARKKVIGCIDVC